MLFVRQYATEFVEAHLRPMLTSMDGTMLRGCLENNSPGVS